jgi:hypothetical protein
MERHRYEVTRAWYLRVKAGPHDTERTCDCGAVFAPRFGGRPQRWCSTTCPAKRAERSGRSKDWYHHNRAYACAREHRRRSADTHKARLSDLRKSGMNQEIYDRLLAAQGGKCAICRTDKPSKRRAYFDIDHCHVTGTLRGLLCERCNRGIGYFNDSPARLRAAADYLERGSKLPYITVKNR